MREEPQDANLDLFFEHVFACSSFLDESQVLQFFKMVDGYAGAGEAQRSLDLANAHSMRWLLYQVPVYEQSFPLQLRFQNAQIKFVWSFGHEQSPDTG